MAALAAKKSAAARKMLSGSREGAVYASRPLTTRSIPP
jgi:hypothetical protein